MVSSPWSPAGRQLYDLCSETLVLGLRRGLALAGLWLLSRMGTACIRPLPPDDGYVSLINQAMRLIYVHTS